VRFAPAPATQADAEAAASALARWLGEAGHPVHQIRVPALRRHPHFSQMATVQQAPARLALSMILLVAGGVMAITAFNVKRA